MRNINSIKTTEDFQKIYRLHDSKANRDLVMYKAKGTGRIGIVCSKKIGNSVIRHHFARLVREVYRLNKKNIRNDIDIIVLARESAKEQGYFDIEKSFISLLKRHSIYVE